MQNRMFAVEKLLLPPGAFFFTFSRPPLHLPDSGQHLRGGAVPILLTETTSWK